MYTNTLLCKPINTDCNYYAVITNTKYIMYSGVEKNKDDAKRHYYSGNRHDAARDILLTEARIEQLAWDTPTCVRRKRKYTKKNADYWEEGILEKRKKPAVSDDTS